MSIEGTKESALECENTRATWRERFVRGGGGRGVKRIEALHHKNLMFCTPRNEK